VAVTVGDEYGALNVVARSDTPGWTCEYGACRTGEPIPPGATVVVDATLTPYDPSFGGRVIVSVGGGASAESDLTNNGAAVTVGP
jgi:hypothetical protein